MLALSLSLSLMLAAASADPVDAAMRTARTEYEWFHAHPELSKKEVQTAKHLADALRGLGLEVHEGIGGTGIVAILEGKGDGPTVLYRADMDAPYGPARSAPRSRRSSVPTRSSVTSPRSGVRISACLGPHSAYPRSCGSSAP